MIAINSFNSNHYATPNNKPHLLDFIIFYETKRSIH